MHIYCQTTAAIVIIPVLDESGIMRIPSVDPANPGLLLEVRPLTPIIEQIMALVGSTLALDRPGAVYRVCDEELGSVELAGSVPATVYLLRAAVPAATLRTDWPTFPQLLRAMPATRARLIWLKAWQVLTGGLESQTKAIEVEG